MNKTYRLVRNARTGLWVAVSECGRAGGKGAMAAVLLAAGALLAGGALAQNAPAAGALPTGGQVTAGQAQIQQSGTTMTIQQGSDRAAIDWQSFNVGSQAHVNFQQPSAQSVALNRVVGADPSQIFGRISANGQVFLSNPSGVYFSPSASVDVAGLVATTHRISLTDFMAGRVRFERQGATGSVVNEGELRAALGGYIALLAPEVRNQGVVVANMGTVALAAGEAFELRFDANNTLAGLRVEPSTIRALVDNRRAVLAPGGLVILSAQAMDRVQGGVVRNSGRIEATGLAQRGGRIVLAASSQIDNSGSVSASATAEGPAGSVRLEAPVVANSGSITATGSAAHPQGGTVAIVADRVVQAATGVIDASAPVQGGSVQISATTQVELGGRVAVNATAATAAPSATSSSTPSSEAVPTQGGSIAIEAPRITLASATLDASGDRGGQIVIDASAPAPTVPWTPPVPAPEPTQVALLGNTQLSSRGRRGQGGDLTLLGDRIDLADQTALDASGATGGGTVRVGGGWQGASGWYQATTVTMAAGASIDASATLQGDGGTVVLWSDVTREDGHTRVDGRILARGGAQGGNGGQVETSGHAVATDGIRVDAGAAQGKGGVGGLWLIDPYNYTINQTAANNIGATLSNGTSVTVTTTVGDTSQGGSSTLATGPQDGWITLANNTAIAKTSGGDATLTLRAHSSITLNAGSSITASGSGTGKLNLVLLADWDSANGGSISLAGSSGAVNINTNGGHVWMGGNSYATGEQYASQRWNGLQVGGGYANSGNATAAWEGVSLNNANVTTSGGDLFIAGRGSHTDHDSFGVIIRNSRVDTGSGNISVTGVLQAARDDVSSINAGLMIEAGSRLTTTSGSITLRGETANTAILTNGTDYASRIFGAYLHNQVTVSTGSGAINLYGTTTADSATGAAVWLGSSSPNSAGNGNQSGGTGNGYNVALVSDSGAILVDARADNNIAASRTDGWQHAFAVIAYGSDKHLVKTNSGNVTVKGHANIRRDDSSGVQLQVNTAPGAIHFVSTSGDIYVQGYQQSGSGAVANNAMRLTADGGAESIRFGAVSDGAAYSGRMTFEADSIWSRGATADSIKAYGSGAITFQSTGARSVKNFLLAGTDVNGNLTQNSLWNFGSAHSSFSIGKPTETRTVTIGSAITAAGPITVYGGDIVLNNDLTATQAGASIRLLASGSITSSAANGTSLELTTNAGNVLLAADTDGSGGGNIDFSQQNLGIDTGSGPKGSKSAAETGGGSITLGGGNLLGSGYATGYNNDSAEGIRARNMTLRSGGGAIDLRGRSWSGAVSADYGAWGVGFFQDANSGNLTADSGAGRIRIEGIGRATGNDSYKQGVAVYGATSLRSSYAGNDAIQVIGTVTATGGSYRNAVDLRGTATLAATGAGGGLTVQGTTTYSAVVFRGSANLLTNGGDLRVIGVAGAGAGRNELYLGNANNVWFGSRAGTDVTSSTSNVLIEVDSSYWESTQRPNIATTGKVTLQSNAAAFAQEFRSEWFRWNQNNQIISGLTFGKVTNTSQDIWLNGTAGAVGSSGSAPLVVNGAVTVYGKSVKVADQPLQVTGTGDIYLRAYQDGQNSIDLSAAINKTGGGDATLTVRGNGRVTLASNITASGAGTGRLNLVAWSDADGNRLGGVSFGGANFITNGGHVWIGGGAGSTTWNGLTVGDGASPGAYSSNYNGVDLRGSFTTAGGDFYVAGKSYVSTVSNWDIATLSNVVVNTGSGNVTFVGNRVDFGGVYVANVTTAIQSTGTLNIRPWDDNFTYGFNIKGAVSGNDWRGTTVASETSSGSESVRATTAIDKELTGTANLIIRNVASLGGLVVGKATNTSAITVHSSLGILGDISLYGGRIANAGAASLTSTGGNILLDADRGRGLDFNGRGISWLGGGLNASSTAAGKGNLTLRGRGGSKVGSNQGVYVGGAVLDARGDLLIQGISPAQQNTGIYVDSGTTLDAGRTLTLDGRNQATVSSANNRGVLLANGATVKSVGALRITGATGPGTANAVEFGNDVKVSTSGSAGHIQIQALNGGSIASVSGGSNAASSITASGGGDITLTADRLAIDASKPLTLSTTGELAIEPFSANFPATFTWNGTLSAGDLLGADSLANVRIQQMANLGGLRLGKAGNTSNLVVAAAMAAKGPVRLYGRDIAINAGITASGNAEAARNRIVLTATGDVTQTAALAANGLSLQGSGRFVLGHSGNNVSVLAAGGPGAPVGRLTYLDADGLSIGTVDGASGIAASGTVRVETRTGNLGVNASVVTSSSSTDAVVLNAGRDKGAADADFFSGAGGSITVANGATVTTGMGGRATLYTGSLAGSTGLEALVGSGSGRFRYASDEVTTNYLSPLATGLYAIYREQPTITLRGVDQAVVYGDEATLSVGASGLRNGDSVAQGAGRLPTVTLMDGGTTATRNSRGHYDVRRAGGAVSGYGMTLSRDAASSLGYALAYDDSGSVTVTPRALSAVINDDAKFVTLADNAGYAGATFSGFARGESAADVSSSATIVRSVAGEAVGTYTGALTGNVNVTTGNYVLDPSRVTAGDFHIVGPEALIVRVSSATAVYGETAAYDVSQVRYYDSVNGVERSLVRGADAFHWTLGGNAAASVGFSLTSAGVNFGSHAITGTVVTPHGLPGTTSSSTPGQLVAIGGRLTITPRTVTLSASKTYDGSAALDAGAITFGNLVGGQTLTYTGAQASDRNVATAGKYVSALTLGDGTGLASNYQLPSLVQAAAGLNTVTITPRTLGVAVDKVYDGLASATAAQTTLTNLAQGESLSILGVALSDSHVTTAGKYVSTLTLADNGPYRLSNYTLPGLAAAGARNSVNIQAATLTVNIASASGTGKVYDGTDATIGFGATFGVNGYVTGDSGANFNYTALYDTRTVDATRITLGNMSLTGVSSTVGSRTSDYVLDVSGASTAGSITPRTVNAASAASPEKVYDGTTSMSGAAVSIAAGSGSTGQVAGDALGIMAVGGSYTQSNAGTGLAYNLVDITLTGADARNYVLASASISGNDGTIKPRTLTLTAGKTYDGTTALTDVTLGNLVQGEYLLVSGLTLASAHVAGPDDNVATADNYVRNITLSNVTDGGTAVYRTTNYCLPGAGCTAVASGVARTLNASVGNQATVTAARLTVGIAETQVSKVYDGTTQGSGGYTYVVNGLVANDSAATLTQTGAVFNDANVAGANSFTLSGITVSGVTGSIGSRASDYVLDATSLTLPGSITARAVAVDVAAGVRKTYDGTSGFDNLQLSLRDVNGNAQSGVVAADASRLTVVAGGGGFDDKNAGSGKSYTLTGLTLTGSAAGNYQLASGGSLSGLNGVIDPKQLHVAGLSTVSKAYDGNTSASYTANQTGTLNTVAVGSGSGSDGRAYAGDNVVLGGSVTGGAFNSKDVLTATHVDFTGFSLSGADAGNYTVVGRAAASITARALTSTTVLGGKTYDGTTGVAVTGVTLGNLVAGETLTVNGTGTLDSANAGNRTATVSYQLGNGNGGGLASNYSLGSIQRAVTVERKALTVTGSTAAGKTYDGTTAASVTAGTLGGLVGNETVNVSASGTFDSANAGNRSVTAVYTLADGTLGGLAANYRLDNGTLAATIGTRAITVAAETASRVYGDANPAFAFTVGGLGLATGDTVGNVFTGALGSTATATSGVGSYFITQGTLAANANYTLSYLGDTLAVTQRAITVSADAASRVYGDANPVFDYSVTSGNLVNGDLFSGALTSGATATSNVGSYAITQGSLTAGGNYALTYAGNQLTVTPRAITVTANGVSRAYGDANPSLTYAVGGSGLANGDTLGGALASVANATSNVGSYAITQGTLAASSNYTLSYVGNQLAVTQRAITVSADAASRVYGDANPLFSYTVTSGNLVNGDTFSGALTNAASATSNVGSYAITQGTLAASSNYALTYVGSQLTVTQRAITVSADAASRVYGDANPLFSYNVTSGNLVNGDTFSGALTSGASATSNVGSYAITQGTLAASSNYALTYVGSQLAVTQRAITVSADAASRVYGDANPGLTYTVGGSGLANGDTLGGALTSAASAASDVGSYAITQGTLAANANYALTYVGNQLAVTPRAITVTGNAASRVYGDANPAFVYTVGGGGLVNGDTLASVFSGALSSAATATSDVGNYAIGQGDLSVASGNYQLTGYTGGTLSVTPRTVTVTGFLANNKTYDGTTAAGVAHWGSVSTGVGSETLVVSGTAANFADASAGTAKTVTATGYTLADGAGGGRASNYQLASTTATTTADIDKAVLTVVANNDAKFVTMTDAAGYAGVTYEGFVAGETAAVLGGTGTVSVSRSNAGVDAANTYTGVLVANTSGLTSGNYQFVARNGDFTIVGSNQLLVRVATANTTYGAAATYVVTSAEYFDGSTTHSLSLADIADGNNRFTIRDGANGSASFDVLPQGAALSGAGYLKSGNYQLGAGGISTVNPQNFSNTVTIVGSHDVTARAVTADATGGVSKVYDGTTAMHGLQLGLSGLLAGDSVSASGTGTFANRQVGTGLAYTVSGLALGGDDAGNYFLVGGNSFTGNNGSITPRTLVVTYSGVDKVYDGGTVAAVTTTDNRITGDSFSIGRTAQFGDKNVGTGKAIAVSGVQLSGDDAANYVVLSTGTTSAAITRLDSVTWIGGPSGNWFDPANWAGGAVPDLSNVANVVIPAGVTVTFDTAGLVAPAQGGPVHIDSLGGAGGGLVQNNGALDVGAGGVTLDTLHQNGGTLHSAGDITVNDFAQTGGQTSTGGNLTVHENFSQSPGGSVTVQGNASITDTSGGTTIGNIAVGGDLDVTSTDGDVTQAGGTAITVAGETTVDAGTGNIVLDGPGNDFQGPVNASGHDIQVVDGAGGLVIGNIDATGNLNASSTDSDIRQQPGSTIVVGGSATLTAPQGVVLLASAGNVFIGDLLVNGASPASGLVLPPVPSVTLLPTPASAPPVLDESAPLTLAAAQAVVRDGNGLSVRVLRPASAARPGEILVKVPRRLAATGFSLPLPAEATAGAPADAQVAVTLEDGSALPAWLRFDRAGRRLEVQALPAGALPLRLMVAAGLSRCVLLLELE